MGNDISSLPAGADEEMNSVPPEVLEYIQKGGFTDEQIQQILLEGVDGQTFKQIGEKKRNSGGGSSSSNPKGRQQRKQTARGADFKRSATDSNVDYHQNQKNKKSLDGHHKKKRSDLRRMKTKDSADHQQQLNPQQVIKLLERYSTMDTKKADAYFKSLQRHHQTTTVSRDDGANATSPMPSISKAA